MSEADEMVRELRDEALVLHGVASRNMSGGHETILSAHLAERAADLIEAQAARIAELERERGEAQAIAKRFEERQGRLVVLGAEVRERAEAAEAERDRMRAALEEIRDSDMKRGHPCEPPEYGHCGRIARAALAPTEPSGNPGRLPEVGDE